MNTPKHADRYDAVQLGLMMPADQAVALANEIREARRAGEPAAININVMHIKMLASTGDMPDSPCTGDGPQLGYGTR